MARYKVKEKKEKKPLTKKQKIMTNILLVLFSGIFLVSAWLLLDEMFISAYFNDQVLNEFQQELESANSTVSVSPEISTDDESSEESSDVVVEEEDDNYVSAINELRSTYEDLVGWIDIENTDMQFPVVDPPDSTPLYYLYRNYKGESSSYGTIFHDESSSIYSTNQLLHGHSMLDGSMFYSLISFSDLDVYKESPRIFYDTYEESSVYKIVAVIKTNLLSSQGEVFDYFQCDFSSDEEKMQYIYEIMCRSIIDTGVDINVDDEFLTLSTCSYEFTDFRTVIVARKVREDEDPEVDTSQAFIRSDTLYPDIWYTKYGGSSPNLPDTFEEAKELGLTDWWYVE